MAVLDVDTDAGSSIRDTSNVLLLAPSLDSSETTACGNLLTLGRAEQTDVLFVSLTRLAEECLTVWDQHAGTPPANMGIITLGNGTQGATTETTVPPTHQNQVTIKTVSNAADLTQIGIGLTEFLSTWETNRNQIVVCFHSVTTLLQYVGLKRAFRFLHVFTGHTKSAGAVAHYHMDRTAHDEREFNTIKNLFDTVLQADNTTEGGTNVAR